MESWTVPLKKKKKSTEWPLAVWRKDRKLYACAEAGLPAGGGDVSWAPEKGSWKDEKEREIHKLFTNPANIGDKPF